MRESIAYDKNHIEREAMDFYATPIEEVENILKYESIEGVVLEPNCGMGHICNGIIKSGFEGEIIATDLVYRGYGIGGLDFLDNNYPYSKNIGTIIMNPPFKNIESFVSKALDIAENKVLLLARNQFLEGSKRYETVLRDNPPSRIYQYVDRIACAKGGDFEKKLVHSMAFAWFVWDKNSNSKQSEIFWIRRVGKE